MLRFIEGDQTSQNCTQDIAPWSGRQPGRIWPRLPYGFSSTAFGAWSVRGAGCGAASEPRLAEEPCSVAWAPANAGAPITSPAAVASAVSPAANLRRRVEWDIRWFLCSFLVPLKASVTFIG